VVSDHWFILKTEQYTLEKNSFYTVSLAEVQKSEQTGIARAEQCRGGATEEGLS
jgi:hypothetical protein